MPASQRNIVVNLLHHGDHPSIDETIRRVARDYYWPGLRRDIKEFVRSCHPCQLAKQAKTVNPGVGKFEVPDTRFSVIHLDIVGPLPKSQDGYRFLLTCFDRTSRWFEAYPLRQASAPEVAEAFLQWISRFGVCDRAISDNGNCFVSRVFEEIMKTFNIEVTFTPAYHAATNGAIERQHQTMKNSLKAALVDMGDKHREQWTRALPWVLLGKRVQYQPFLDSSSAQLVLGKSPRLPGQLLKEPGPPLNTVETRALLDQLYKLHDHPGIKTSTKTTELDISYTDQATHVYIKVDSPQSLCPRFEGPYKIHSRPSRSTIDIILGVKNNGDLRIQRYHWSSAKVAHLREGVEAAERPKLGRPKAEVGLSSNKSITNSRQIENPSVNVHATGRGDGAGHTDTSKQIDDGQPIKTRARTQRSSKPITARPAVLPSTANIQTRTSRPIARPTVNTNDKPAKIQKRDYDTLSGKQPHPGYIEKGPIITTEMFQKWTPDLLGLPSASERPVRSTRNRNPTYVDAMWSASKDELAMINYSVSNRHK